MGDRGTTFALFLAAAAALLVALVVGRLSPRRPVAPAPCASVVEYKPRGGYLWTRTAEVCGGQRTGETLWRNTYRWVGDADACWSPVGWAPEPPRTRARRSAPDAGPVDSGFSGLIYVGGSVGFTPSAFPRIPVGQL